ncbi:hypothetical protein ACFL35_18290 [Candidatus Riflebacteria bacterium]
MKENNKDSSLFIRLRKTGDREDIYWLPRTKLSPFQENFLTELNDPESLLICFTDEDDESAFNSQKPESFLECYSNWREQIISLKSKGNKKKILWISGTAIEKILPFIGASGKRFFSIAGPFTDCIFSCPLKKIMTVLEPLLAAGRNYLVRAGELEYHGQSLIMRQKNLLFSAGNGTAFC